MRKITRLAAEAFRDARPCKCGNTKVDCILDNHGTQVTRFILHENQIAAFAGLKLRINFCGYNTTVTRERINGLLEVLGYKQRFRSRRNQLQVFNGIAWVNVSPTETYTVSR